MNLTFKVGGSRLFDLESQKKNCQEQFLKPTHETKHDGIYQL